MIARAASANSHPAAAARGQRPSALVLLAALLLPIAGAQQPGPAQQASFSQYDVEAVYLYNFAKFVRWPAATPQKALDICIAGRKEYTDTLTKTVAGETIGGRALAVRTVLKPEDVAGCDILFLGATDKARFDSLLAAAAGKPVLTVSDTPGFLERGGMIQFEVIGNRVRFSVNLGPVTRSGLSLSSELLKVAVSVSGQAAAGGAP